MILSTIIFAISLLCGVQGNDKCVAVSFCGCQLQDADNKSIINITLDSFDNMYGDEFIIDIIVAVSPFKHI